MSPVTKVKAGAARPTERKRIVKYLAVCRDPKAYRAVLQAAPDSVIKTICDAALNVERGERVVLNRPEKKLFSRHRASIAQLASKSVPLVRKRKLLTQRGGFFPILPVLLGAALRSLGPLLIGKLAAATTRDSGGKKSAV